MNGTPLVFLRKATAGISAAVFLLTNVLFPSRPLWAFNEKTNRSSLWEERRKTLKNPLVGDLALGPRTAAPLLPPLGKMSSPILSPDYLPPSIQKGKAFRFPWSAEELPLAHGDIQEVLYGGENRPWVVLIQDVHGQEEAQRNIGKMVEMLAVPGRPVLLEGAAGPLDLEKFRGDAAPEVLRRVANHLLKKDWISGPQWAGLARKAPLLLSGAEDLAAYEAHLAAFWAARKSLPVFEKQWASRARSLGDQKVRFLGPALQEAESRRAGLDKGTVPLQKVFEGLLQGANTAGYPNIRTFMDLAAAESRLDFARAERERDVFFQNLLPRLSSVDRDGLVRLAAAYRSGRLEAGPFYRRLRALGESHGIALSGVPAFDAFVLYVLKAEGLDRRALHREWENLEEDFARRHARSPREKALWDLARRDILIEKMAAQSLTPEEWARFQNTTDRGREWDLPSLDEKSLRSFQNFYEWADGRNDGLVAHTLARAGRGPVQAVLVAGGYHTPGLLERFKARGRNVLVLAPKLSQIKDLRPMAGFLKERTPLDKILLGERLFLPPPLLLGVSQIPRDQEPLRAGRTAYVHSLLSFLKTGVETLSLRVGGRDLTFVSAARAGSFPGRPVDAGEGFSVYLRSSSLWEKILKIGGTAAVAVGAFHTSLGEWVWSALSSQFLAGAFLLTANSTSEPPASDPRSLKEVFEENQRLRGELVRAVQTNKKDDALKTMGLLISSSEALSEKLQTEGEGEFREMLASFGGKFELLLTESNALSALFNEFVDLGRRALPEDQRSLLVHLSEELAQELFPEDSDRRTETKSKLKAALGTASLSQYLNKDLFNEFFDHEEFKRMVLELMDPFQSILKRATFLVPQKKLVFKGGLEASELKGAFKHEAIHFLAEAGLIKVDYRSEQFPHASQVLELVKNGGTTALDSPEIENSFGLPVGDLYRLGERMGARGELGFVVRPGASGENFNYYSAAPLLSKAAGVLVQRGFNKSILMDPYRAQAAVGVLLAGILAGRRKNDGTLQPTALLREIFEALHRRLGPPSEEETVFLEKSKKFMKDMLTGMGIYNPALQPKTAGGDWEFQRKDHGGTLYYVPSDLYLRGTGNPREVKEKVESRMKGLVYLAVKGEENQREEERHKSPHKGEVAHRALWRTLLLPRTVFEIIQATSNTSTLDQLKGTKGGGQWMWEIFQHRYHSGDEEYDRALLGTLPLHLQYLDSLLYRWAHYSRTKKELTDPRLSNARVEAAVRATVGSFQEKKAGWARVMLDAAFAGGDRFLRTVDEKIWPTYQKLYQEALKNEEAELAATQMLEGEAQNQRQQLNDSLEELMRDPEFQKRLKEYWEGLSEAQRQALQAQARETLQRETQGYSNFRENLLGEDPLSSAAPGLSPGAAGGPGIPLPVPGTGVSRPSPAPQEGNSREGEPKDSPGEGKAPPSTPSSRSKPKGSPKPLTVKDAPDDLKGLSDNISSVPPSPSSTPKPQFHLNSLPPMEIVFPGLNAEESRDYLKIIAPLENLIKKIRTVVPTLLHWTEGSKLEAGFRSGLMTDAVQTLQTGRGFSQLTPAHPVPLRMTVLMDRSGSQWGNSKREAINRILVSFAEMAFALQKVAAESEVKNLFTFSIGFFDHEKDQLLSHKTSAGFRSKKISKQSVIYHLIQASRPRGATELAQTFKDFHGELLETKKTTEMESPARKILIIGSDMELHEEDIRSLRDHLSEYAKKTSPSDRVLTVFVPMEENVYSERLREALGEQALVLAVTDLNKLHEQLLEVIKAAANPEIDPLPKNLSKSLGMSGRLGALYRPFLQRGWYKSAALLAAALESGGAMVLGMVFAAVVGPYWEPLFQFFFFVALHYGAPLSRWVQGENGERRLQSDGAPLTWKDLPSLLGIGLLGVLFHWAVPLGVSLDPVLAAIGAHGLYNLGTPFFLGMTGDKQSSLPYRRFHIEDIRGIPTLVYRHGGEELFFQRAPDLEGHPVPEVYLEDVPANEDYLIQLIKANFINGAVYMVKTSDQKGWFRPGAGSNMEYWEQDPSGTWNRTAEFSRTQAMPMTSKGEDGTRTFTKDGVSWSFKKGEPNSLRIQMGDGEDFLPVHGWDQNFPDNFVVHRKSENELLFFAPDPLHPALFVLKKEKSSWRVVESLRTDFLSRRESFVGLVGPRGVAKGRFIDAMATLMNLPKMTVAGHGKILGDELVKTTHIGQKDFGRQTTELSPIAYCWRHGGLAVLDEEDMVRLNAKDALKTMMAGGKSLSADGSAQEEQNPWGRLITTRNDTAKDDEAWTSRRRDIHVLWVPPDQEMEWQYRRARETAGALNREPGFDLKTTVEKLVKVAVGLRLAAEGYSNLQREEILKTENRGEGDVFIQWAPLLLGRGGKRAVPAAAETGRVHRAPSPRVIENILRHFVTFPRDAALRPWSVIENYFNFSAEGDARDSYESQVKSAFQFVGFEDETDRDPFPFFTGKSFSLQGERKNPILRLAPESPEGGPSSEWDPVEIPLHPDSNFAKDEELSKELLKYIETPSNRLRLYQALQTWNLGLPILLGGEPSSGKSKLKELLLGLQGGPDLVETSVSSETPLADLFYSVQIGPPGHEAGKTVYVPSRILTAGASGKAAALEEFHLLPKDMQMGLTEALQTGVFRLPDHREFKMPLLILLFNTPEENTGVSQRFRILPPAVLERGPVFHHTPLSPREALEQLGEVKVGEKFLNPRLLGELPTNEDGSFGVYTAEDGSRRENWYGLVGVMDYIRAHSSHFPKPFYFRELKELVQSIAHNDAVRLEKHVADWKNRGSLPQEELFDLLRGAMRWPSGAPEEVAGWEENLKLAMYRSGLWNVQADASRFHQGGSSLAEMEEDPALSIDGLVHFLKGEGVFVRQFPPLDPVPHTGLVSVDQSLVYLQIHTLGSRVGEEIKNIDVQVRSARVSWKEKSFRDKMNVVHLHGQIHGELERILTERTEHMPDTQQKIKALQAELKGFLFTEGWPPAVLEGNTSLEGWLSQYTLPLSGDFVSDDLLGKIQLFSSHEDYIPGVLQRLQEFSDQKDSWGIHSTRPLQKAFDVLISALRERPLQTQIQAIKDQLLRNLSERPWLMVLSERLHELKNKISSDFPDHPQEPVFTSQDNPLSQHLTSEGLKKVMGELTVWISESETKTMIELDSGNLEDSASSDPLEMYQEYLGRNNKALEKLRSNNPREILPFDILLKRLLRERTERSIFSNKTLRGLKIFPIDVSPDGQRAVFMLEEDGKKYSTKYLLKDEAYRFGFGKFRSELLDFPLFDDEGNELLAIQLNPTTIEFKLWDISQADFVPLFVRVVEEGTQVEPLLFVNGKLFIKYKEISGPTRYAYRERGSDFGWRPIEPNMFEMDCLKIGGYVSDEFGWATPLSPPLSSGEEMEVWWKRWGALKEDLLLVVEQGLQSLMGSEEATSKDLLKEPIPKIKTWGKTVGSAVLFFMETLNRHLEVLLKASPSTSLEASHRTQAEKAVQLLGATLQFLMGIQLHIEKLNKPEGLATKAKGFPSGNSKGWTPREGERFVGSIPSYLNVGYEGADPTDEELLVLKDENENIVVQAVVSDIPFSSDRGRAVFNGVIAEDLSSPQISTFVFDPQKREVMRYLPKKIIWKGERYDFNQIQSVLISGDGQRVLAWGWVVNPRMGSAQWGLAVFDLEKSAWIGLHWPDHLEGYGKETRLLAASETGEFVVLRSVQAHHSITIYSVFNAFQGKVEKNFSSPAMEGKNMASPQIEAVMSKAGETVAFRVKDAGGAGWGRISVFNNTLGDPVFRSGVIGENMKVGPLSGKIVDLGFPAVSADGVRLAFTVMLEEDRAGGKKVVNPHVVIADIRSNQFIGFLQLNLENFKDGEIDSIDDPRTPRPQRFLEDRGLEVLDQSATGQDRLRTYDPREEGSPNALPMEASAQENPPTWWSDGIIRHGGEIPSYFASSSQDVRRPLAGEKLMLSRFNGVFPVESLFGPIRYSSDRTKALLYGEIEMVWDTVLFAPEHLEVLRTLPRSFQVNKVLYELVQTQSVLLSGDGSKVFVWGKTKTGSTESSWDLLVFEFESGETHRYEVEVDEIHGKNMSLLASSETGDRVILNIGDTKWAVLDVTGGEPEAVFEGEGNSPVLSGDGKQVAFLENIESGKQISVYDIESRKKIYETTNSEDGILWGELGDRRGTLLDLGFPLLSFKGDRLAFTVLLEEERSSGVKVTNPHVVVIDIPSKKRLATIPHKLNFKDGEIRSLVEPQVPRPQRFLEDGSLEILSQSLTNKDHFIIYHLPKGFHLGAPLAPNVLSAGARALQAVLSALWDALNKKPESALEDESFKRHWTLIQAEPDNIPLKAMKKAIKAFSGAKTRIDHVEISEEPNRRAGGAPIVLVKVQFTRKKETRYQYFIVNVKTGEMISPVGDPHKPEDTTSTYALSGDGLTAVWEAADETDRSTYAFHSFDLQKSKITSGKSLLDVGVFVSQQGPLRADVHDPMALSWDGSKRARILYPVGDNQRPDKSKPGLMVFQSGMDGLKYLPVAEIWKTQGQTHSLEKIAFFGKGEGPWVGVQMGVGAPSISRMAIFDWRTEKLLMTDVGWISKEEIYKRFEGATPLDLIVDFPLISEDLKTVAVPVRTSAEKGGKGKLFIFDGDFKTLRAVLPGVGEDVWDEKNHEIHTVGQIDGLPGWAVKVSKLYTVHAFLSISPEGREVTVRGQDNKGQFHILKLQNPDLSAPAQTVKTRQAYDLWLARWGASFRSQAIPESIFTGVYEFGRYLWWTPLLLGGILHALAPPLAPMIFAAGPLLPLLAPILLSHTLRPLFVQAHAPETRAGLRGLSRQLAWIYGLAGSLLGLGLPIFGLWVALGGILRHIVYDIPRLPPRRPDASALADQIQRTDFKLTGTFPPMSLEAKSVLEGFSPQVVTLSPREQDRQKLLDLFPAAGNPVSLREGLERLVAIENADHLAALFFLAHRRASGEKVTLEGMKNFFVQFLWRQAAARASSVPRGSETPLRGPLVQDISLLLDPQATSDAKQKRAETLRSIQDRHLGPVVYVSTRGTQDEMAAAVTRWTGKGEKDAQILSEGYRSAQRIDAEKLQTALQAAQRPEGSQTGRAPYKFYLSTDDITRFDRLTPDALLGLILQTLSGPIALTSQDLEKALQHLHLLSLQA